MLAVCLSHLECVKVSGKILSEDDSMIHSRIDFR